MKLSCKSSNWTRWYCWLFVECCSRTSDFFCDCLFRICWAGLASVLIASDCSWWGQYISDFLQWRYASDSTSNALRSPWIPVEGVRVVHDLVLSRCSRSFRMRSCCYQRSWRSKINLLHFEVIIFCGMAIYEFKTTFDEEIRNVTVLSADWLIHHSMSPCWWWNPIWWRRWQYLPLV